MDSTKYFVHTVRNGIFPSNTYLIEDVTSNELVIVDPGLDTAAVENALAQLTCTPIAILATHGHFDHIGSVKVFRDKYSIPYYLHEADVKLAKAANFYLKMTKLPGMISIASPDFVLRGLHQVVPIGGFQFQAHNYPGHSDGSCVFQLGELLFSGDTIYKKGLGFNSFPGENREKLKASIKAMLEAFSPESMVYPGHGEAEKLGVIAATNNDLLAFLHLNQIVK